MVRFVTNNFRLVAVLFLVAIAAAFVFLGPGSIEVAYNANNLTTEQSAKQQELLAEYSARVYIVDFDESKRYVFSDGRWSDKRPYYLDENDRPFLTDNDMQKVAQQVPISAPSWMFAGHQLSTYDYNILLNTTKAAIWLVFISAFLWLTMFTGEEEDFSKTSAGGVLLMAIGMGMAAIFPFIATAIVVWLSTRVVQPALPIVAYLLFAVPFIWLYRNELRNMNGPARDNGLATTEGSCDAKAC